MDWDGDGIEDLISGSYDPGDIWLFAGQGKGKFAAGRVLVDETGLPLVHHPEELAKFNELRKTKAEDDDEAIHARVASFGSWPAPVDWDADGDLDLLIGTFGGDIHLRTNVGTRKAPKFSSASPAIGVHVAHHAAPVVADWDGDGSWDLVVGAADGSVTWFRNTGAPNKPKFGDGVVLVAKKADDMFLRQYLAAGEPGAPAVRAQVCVVDFDLDGKLDLLVGDYRDVKELRPDLTAAQRAELEALAVRERELLVDPKAHTEELAALAKQREPFCVGEGRRQSHVWLYRRIGP